MSANETDMMECHAGCECWVERDMSDVRRGLEWFRRDLNAAEKLGDSVRVGYCKRRIAQHWRELARLQGVLADAVAAHGFCRAYRVTYELER